MCDSGSEWGQANGDCVEQEEPIPGSSYPGGSHRAEIVLERVIKGIRNPPVYLLDVTTLSQLRKDGHPSVYGFGGHRNVDCSHWCLAGVPDTWNQLLYASSII